MTSTKASNTRSGARKPGKSAKSRALSRLHKPDDMGLEEWQTALRRQFGCKQKFKLENLGKSAGVLRVPRQ